MARLYAIGADLERKQCHEAISGGALIAMRGAGSKCYSKDSKYKIDTIFIYRDKIILCQQKKKGTIPKRELAKLIELQRILPQVEVMIGDTTGLKNVRTMMGKLFSKRV